MYTASVVALGQVHAHPNADRVKLTRINGCQVVVGLDAKEGDVGVYFPTDGQLTPEFLKANSLYREAYMNADKNQTGMFDANGRVRAQKFRGEVSDGFWLPISCLNFTGNHNLKVGDDFTTCNNVEICRKYVTPETRQAAASKQTKAAKKSKTSVMFKEHFDTDQLGKNLFKIPIDREIVITEKLHGTSGRVGHVLRQRELSWLEKLAKKFGVQVQESEWVYLNGSRRVVLQESKSDGYHDKTIRTKAMSLFEGKLHKGETVYFEIVGFEPSGAPIMPKASNEALGKEFVKKWGKSTTYKYGCSPEESRVYVYRITQTNEDGVSFDLLWEDIVARCKELNVTTVPFIGKFQLLDSVFMKNVSVEEETTVHDLADQLREEFFKEVEKLSKGASRLDSDHISEGVCVRVNNQVLANMTFKHKSFEFKVLEGIVKDAGVVDVEEAQSELVKEELSA